MTQPQPLTIAPTYEGTTWGGIIQIDLDLTGGAPFDLTGAALRMIYRRMGERVERVVLSLGAGIEMINASLGQFRVPPQVLPLEAGVYYWELIMTKADGIILPLLIGTHEITRHGLHL